ncbi:MAG TPA: methylcrotonoyl-CoA carboxylase, partial [Caulobacteraceae bacterium]|nr:methylcrotonoyl-CoA carboxylase [Caulobacteraceae bacterium]
MSRLTSSVDPASDPFAKNAQANRALVDELRAKVAQAALGGPEASREKHTARGKLLPRERVER